MGGINCKCNKKIINKKWILFRWENHCLNYAELLLIQFQKDKVNASIHFRISSFALSGALR